MHLPGGKETDALEEDEAAAIGWILEYVSVLVSIILVMLSALKSVPRNPPELVGFPHEGRESSLGTWPEERRRTRLRKMRRRVRRWTLDSRILSVWVHEY